MAQLITAGQKDETVAPVPGPREIARYWRDPNVEGLEMLRANFVTHAFPRHTHEEHFVIGAIESGVQACITGGGLEYYPVGTVVLLNPGVVHTGRAFDGIGYAYRALYPDVRLMRAIGRELGICDGEHEMPFFRFPYSFHDPELARRLLDLHALLERGEASRLEQDSRMLATLGAAFRVHGEKGTPAPRRSREPAAVRLAKDYLDAHAAQNVSLEALAAVAGLSPYHLLRIFRDAVGVPPHAYQTQVRLDRAKALLGMGMPVAQAAVAVGFVDQSHLTRHFKRLFGVAPGAFLRASTPDRNFIQAAPNVRVLV